MRGRYGSAGKKDHRSDAFGLADAARTDLRRLTPLARHPARREPCATLVRARTDLVTHRLAFGHQLRAHLRHACFLVRSGLFSELDPTDQPGVFGRFGTQDAIDALTPVTLAACLAVSRYSTSPPAEVMPARLREAPGDHRPRRRDALAAVTSAI